MSTLSDISLNSSESVKEFPFAAPTECNLMGDLPNFEVGSLYMESSKRKKDNNIGHQNGSSNTNRLYTRNIHLKHPDIMQTNAYSPLLQGISMISLDVKNSKRKIKSLKQHKMKKNGIKNDHKKKKKMKMNKYSLKRNNFILHQRKMRKQSNMKVKHYLNLRNNKKLKKKNKMNTMNPSSYKLSSILFGDNSVLNIKINNHEISGKDYQKHIKFKTIKKNSRINLLKHQMKKRKNKININEFEDVSESIFKLHGMVNHHCDLKTFQCDICHSKFMHWNQLKEHIQTHSMPLLSI